MADSKTESQLLAERSAAFLGRPSVQLKDDLLRDGGMTISDEQTGRSVKIGDAQAFNEVGERYVAIETLATGVLWTATARRGNREQNLISGPGKSCVRITRAKYHDPSLDGFHNELTIGGETFRQNEGDIARFFSLGKYDVSTLRLGAEPQTLYIRDKSMAKLIPPYAQRPE